MLSEDRWELRVVTTGRNKKSVKIEEQSSVDDLVFGKGHYYDWERTILASNNLGLVLFILLFLLHWWEMAILTINKCDALDNVAVIESCLSYLLFYRLANFWGITTLLLSLYRLLPHLLNNTMGFGLHLLYQARWDTMIWYKYQFSGNAAITTVR